MNEHEFMNITSGINEKLIAEYDAKTPKKRVRYGKRLQFAVGFAMAAVLAVPVGAYAYNAFLHKENVEHYISNGEQLESRGLVLNEQTKTEELEFTVDTLLCDGNLACGVLTVERVGENSGRILDPHSYRVTVVYADTGEYITNHWQGGMSFDGTEKPGQNRHHIMIDVSGVDKSRDIKLLFNKVQKYGNLYGDGKLTGQKDADGIPIRYDSELTLHLTPNVDTAKLHDKAGNEVTLSEFEVYSNTVTWSETVEDAWNFDFKLIDNNGNRHEVEKEYGHVNNYSYVAFSELIDVNEYCGVEINGVEYLK